MKPAFQKQAWLVAVALVTPFACSPLGSAESTESRHATQVALRSRSQPLDPSWPPARGTVTLTEQAPQSVSKLDSGAVLIDFGQVAFGNVELTPPADFDPEDWVELYNAYDVPVDISGWVFKDEDDAHIFILPDNTIIAAGDYLVLCRDDSLFHAAFPEVENHIGNLNVAKFFCQFTGWNLEHLNITPYRGRANN